MLRTRSLTAAPYGELLPSKHPGKLLLLKCVFVAVRSRCNSCSCFIFEPGNNGDWRPLQALLYTPRRQATFPHRNIKFYVKRFCWAQSGDLCMQRNAHIWGFGGVQQRLFGTVCIEQLLNNPVSSQQANKNGRICNNGIQLARTKKSARLKQDAVSCDSPAGGTWCRQHGKLLARQNKSHLVINLTWPMQANRSDNQSKVDMVKCKNKSCRSFFPLQIDQQKSLHVGVFGCLICWTFQATKPQRISLFVEIFWSPTWIVSSSFGKSISAI